MLKSSFLFKVEVTPIKRIISRCPRKFQYSNKFDYHQICLIDVVGLLSTFDQYIDKSMVQIGTFFFACG